MSENPTTSTVTMSAWRQNRYGGPDVVAAERVAVPVPGGGEVVVQVQATSMNAADAHVLRGDPLLLRTAFGLRRPRVATRGMDVAGTVTAVGPGVTAFTVGDDVMGELAGGGGLAEFVVSRADRLVPIPAGLDPVDAAALPLAAGTAWQALELAGVRDGGRVLVIGASGGVGTFAVQLAALRGAEIWALCGVRNQPLVAELGAVRTFDYRTTEVTDLPPSTFDAVLDIGGTAPLRALKALLRPDGIVVMVSGEGGRVLGPIGRILRAVFVSIGGGRRRIRPLAAVAKPDVTRRLAGLAAAGRIHPVIERTYRLDQARDALAHIDAGRTVGKVVVEVS